MSCKPSACMCGGPEGPPLHPRSESKVGVEGRSRRSESKVGVKGRSQRSESKAGVEGRSQRSESKVGVKGRSQRSESKVGVEGRSLAVNGGSMRARLAIILITLTFEVAYVAAQAQARHRLNPMI